MGGKNALEDGLGIIVLFGIAAMLAGKSGSRDRKTPGRGLVTIAAAANGAWCGYMMANGTPLQYDGPMLVGTPVLGGGISAAASSFVRNTDPNYSFRSTLTRAAIAEGVGYGVGYLVGRW